MKILVADILQSKAQTLINTVNCVGVMGKGIALEFKKQFPDMFKDYVARCEQRKRVKPGDTLLLVSACYRPKHHQFPNEGSLEICFADR